MKTINLILAFFALPGLDFASMGAGALGGAMGLYNSQNLPGYQGFVPGNASQNDWRWNYAMQTINDSINRNNGLVDPVLLQSLSQMLGVDLSGLSSAGAAAGGQYQNLSGQAQGAGQAALGMGQSQMQAGRDVFNLGMDPQNQLHDYLQNRTVDASRAATSARGFGTSPLSAGLENEATRNFNMDWENQRLGRAATGAQSMNQSGFYGGQNMGRGLEMGAMAPQFTVQGAMAPIQGQMAQYGMPMDIAGQFTQAQQQDVLGPQMQIQNQINPYLNLSAQAGQQQSQYDFNKAMGRNAMEQQSMYGLFGGGQSQGSNPYGSWGGNQSGGGNPMNWMWMGGLGGSGGGGSGGFQGVGGNPY